MQNTLPTTSELGAAIEGRQMDLLAKVFGQGPVELQHYIIDHPMLTREGVYLAYLLGEEDVRQKAAAHGRVSRTTVESIVSFGSAEVVRAFLQGSSPLKRESAILAELRRRNPNILAAASSMDPNVISLSAEDVANANQARKMGYALNLDTRPDQLEVLSLEKHYKIRLAVARHPNTTIETLVNLGHDDDPRVSEAARQELDALWGGAGGENKDFPSLDGEFDDDPTMDW